MVGEAHRGDRLVAVAPLPEVCVALAVRGGNWQPHARHEGEEQAG